MSLITEKINSVYKLYIGMLAEDMGGPISIKVRTGRNPDIPEEDWDDENDEPLDASVYQDESAWYAYDTYDIEDVLLEYPDDLITPFSVGTMDAQDVKLMCKLESVLVDKSDTNGQTYFELDGFEYVTIEGYNYVRKGVVRKSGLKRTDKFMCEVVLTRRVE